MTVALAVGSLIGAVASAQAPPPSSQASSQTPTPPPPLTPNLAQGKIYSYTCLGCHGIVGYRNAYPNYAVPRLRGQHAAYLLAALKEYRSNARKYPTMHLQASSLSDQQMVDVAAYLAGKPLLATAAMSAGPVPKAAEVCTSCHGQDGVGIAPNYPTLAGQHASYLTRAIREYQTGYRTNPIMNGMVAALTPAEISTIVDYFSRIKPGLKTVPRPMTFLSVKH